MTLKRCWTWWAMLCAAMLAQGAEFYVAPEGQPAGDGSMQNPWDFATAISTNSPVRPGDTVWMRGGTYRGNFTSYLTGGVNNYITLRGYLNERAIIDGAPNPTTYPLTIDGEWTIYRNFEVTQSSTWLKGSITPVAINCIGTNVKVINIVVHDAGMGIGFWTTAINSEVYGCILYHNGADGQEHGIYTQNDVGTKRIRDTIIFNNSGYGIHAYTQGGQVRGFDFEGNIIFNNGSKVEQDSRYDNIFLGGNPPSDRVTVANNLCFITPGFGRPNVRLSDRNHSSNPSGTVSVTGNYIIGGEGFNGDDWRWLTFSNNTVFGSGHLIHCRPPPGFALSSYAWNGNHYISLDGPNAQLFTVDTQAYTFADWRNISALDGASTFATNRSGVEVFFRPNVYEAGRTYMAVYNWDMADNVEIDISRYVAKGSGLQVRNVQDFLGRPVLTNIYDGGLLRMPMTNLSVALPRGQLSGPLPTGPLFNVFVLFSEGGPAASQWNFDEPGGLTATDSISTNAGTLMNGPSRIPGQFGQAMRFDGADDYMNVPDSDSLGVSNQITISLWFNPNQRLDQFSSRRDVLAKFISYWMILNYPYDFGRIGFGLNAGFPVVDTVTSQWDPGHWYHIVGTYNGAALRLYVNGALERQTEASVTINRNAYPLQIGGNSQQGFYFPAALDDVRIYPRALTDSEVLELYRVSAPENHAPRIAEITDQIVGEGGTLNIPVAASDSDLPTDNLTFSLLSGAPAGMSIGPSSGVLTWTPGNQGSSTNLISVKVTDSGNPPLSAVETFVVRVLETNIAPVLSVIPDQTIFERNTLILFNYATDPDGSAGSFTFTLEPGAPEGARINPTSGLFIWTPTETQGPTTNLVTIRVSENNPPNASSTRSFNVHVLETNSPPALNPVPNVTILQGASLAVTNVATDSDIPGNHLTFSLDPGAPPEANIDPLNGVLSWTPPPGMASVTRTFTVRVNDDGSPAMSDTKSFQVTVAPLPELSPLFISGSEVFLLWNSVPGMRYRVQYKDLLNEPSWHDLPGDVVASEEVSFKQDSLSFTQRFYRILVVTP